MAKLYAELTSDKGGRVVGKGGNNEIVITLHEGNAPIMKVTQKDYLDGRIIYTVETMLFGKWSKKYVDGTYYNIPADEQFTQHSA